MLTSSDPDDAATHRDRWESSRAWRQDARLPNLFIIGAPKSGTTSLHAALANTPRTFMSKVKETGFFSSDRQFAQGLEYYAGAYFRSAAGYPVRGESTPWYLYSEKARQRIFDLLGPPTPHIVVLLRRPADRAYSMYLDQRSIGNERRSFESAVADEMAQIESGDLSQNIPKRYIWAGQYGRHVAAWIDTFGAEHVQAFLTSDLRESAEIWRTLAQFLGQDLGEEKLSQLSRRERNVAGALRSRRLDQAVRLIEGHDSRILRRLQKTLPHGWDRRIAQAVWSANQAKRPSPVEPPPVDVLRVLDEYFRRDVTELQRILGRSLASWLPENITRV
ncbi:MAG: hypothetical protein DLM61_18560 [Pseudonocardiales bacterium]|nr:MAG: hypothetical protein DLM61_18560 [Pseudonocardiales bacterium]